MFKKYHRLKKDGDFNTVYRHGRKYQTKELVVYWLWGKAGSAAQFGVVVSKRVSKLASQRNLLKRRLTIALSETFIGLMSSGLRVVVVAKNNARLLDYQQLKEQITIFSELISQNEKSD